MSLTPISSSNVFRLASTTTVVDNNSKSLTQVSSSRQLWFPTSSILPTNSLQGATPTRRTSATSSMVVGIPGTSTIIQDSIASTVTSDSAIKSLTPISSMLEVLSNTKESPLNTQQLPETTSIISRTLLSSSWLTGIASSSMISNVQGSTILASSSNKTESSPSQTNSPSSWQLPSISAHSIDPTTISELIFGGISSISPATTNVPTMHNTTSQGVVSTTTSNTVAAFATSNAESTTSLSHTVLPVESFVPTQVTHSEVSNIFSQMEGNSSSTIATIGNLTQSSLIRPMTSSIMRLPSSEASTTSTSQIKPTHTATSLQATSQVTMSFTYNATSSQIWTPLATISTSSSVSARTLPSISSTFQNSSLATSQVEAVLSKATAITIAIPPSGTNTSSFNSRTSATPISVSDLTVNAYTNSVPTRTKSAQRISATPSLQYPAGLNSTLISRLSNQATASYIISTSSTASSISISASSGNGSSDAHSGAPWRSVVALSSPTSSAGEIPAAPAAPVLTASQTAGVAIGSFTGVLIALVSAIFLVRRYHSAQVTRRSSTESSVYPKVAYLYDPPVRSSRSDGGGDDDFPALMSGGTGGLPPCTPAPVSARTSPEPAEWLSAESSSCSDPGNPFRSPEDIGQMTESTSRDSLRAPIEATAVLAATVAGYTVASRWSPTTSASSTPTRLTHDQVIPTPTLRTFNSSGSLRRSHAISGSRRSLSNWRDRAPKSAYRTISTVVTEYPTHSLYGRLPSHSLAPVRESGVSDPFEHDLLLPIDSWTEARDSAIVYAVSPTIRTFMRPKLPSIDADEDNSMVTLHSWNRTSVPVEPHSSTNEALATLGSSPSHPKPGSPPDDVASLNKLVQSPISPQRPSSLMTGPRSPISPPYAPINLGWDDTKRWSRASGTISPLSPPTPFSFHSPQPNLSPPPKKKRSLIQLRRKELPLIGSGQSKSPSRSGQSLSLNITYSPKQDTSFEGPRMSLLARVNSLAETRSKGFGSPCLAVSDSVYTSDLTEQVKEKNGTIISPTRWNGEDF